MSSPYQPPMFMPEPSRSTNTRQGWTSMTLTVAPSSTAPSVASVPLWPPPTTTTSLVMVSVMADSSMTGASPSHEPSEQ